MTWKTAFLVACVVAWFTLATVAVAFEIEPVKLYLNPMTYLGESLGRNGQ